jgi:hypothetical protein
MAIGLKRGVSRKGWELRAQFMADRILPIKLVSSQRWVWHVIGFGCTVAR